VEATERLAPGALRIKGGGSGEDALTIHGNIGGQGLRTLDSPEHLPRQGHRRQMTATKGVHRID
jgi:hypothetical protein